MPGTNQSSISILSGTPPEASEDKTKGRRDLVARVCGHVIVEPKYGWAIAGPARLLDYSLTYGWQTHTRVGRATVGLPSPTSFLWSKYARRNQVHISTARSLLSPWPENYFHFLVDVLPKLAIMNRSSVDETTPILVSAHLAKQKYFHEAVIQGDLSSLHFVSPKEGTYVALDELFLAQTSIFDKGLTCDVLRLLNAPARTAIPAKRVFLNRRPEYGRCLDNFNDISEILTKLNFTMLYTEDMTLSEQMTLLSETRFLVGIHGAGLANMIFAANGPLSVMEIVPRHADLNQDFELLANSLGFDYVRVFGIDEPYPHKRSNFHVDPESFSNFIEAFIAD
ncbi:MAG: DUF563 domain-containing protein [Dehalococcoidia bacterium]